MPKGPRQPTRTVRAPNIVERNEIAIEDARANASPPPITRRDMGEAGRRMAYVLTGDKEMLPGVRHYDRMPLDTPSTPPARAPRARK